MPTSAFIHKNVALLLLIFVIGGMIGTLSCGGSGASQPLKFVSTVIGMGGEFGEPFGIAVRGDETFISDGQNGCILTLRNGASTVFASGLDTPSAIAFTHSGELLVVDAGTNTIRSIDAQGAVTTIAGGGGVAGFVDGEAYSARFHGPIGLAVADDGRIFVADTYNDRIRVIENGVVRTIAGGSPGFADGAGEHAHFYTPTGIAVWHDKILVADTGNHRIRVVEPDGQVWTLAGTGDADVKDGLLPAATFYQPTGIAVSPNGEIFITDGNAIRRISGDLIPVVTTISALWRGFADGPVSRSRFNRASGIAFSAKGDLLIADSDNRVVREISPEDTGAKVTREQVVAMRDKPAAFRVAQPSRWPYDPPEAKRDIAGTFGELRGEIKAGNTDIHFHNGLDIAGAYGETARFVRSEKALLPMATDNFNTLRELVRMPTLGYIHVRLGRDQTGKPFGDPRFLFTRDEGGKMIDVRIPRGSSFKEGEPIGTLNPMNHVHLIAGRSGSEMNAIDALLFPGLADSRPPTIERTTLTDETWHTLETKTKDGRIQIAGKTRVIMRAYDQVDGNSERRRLGIYQAGYQLLKSDGTPVAEPNWTIKFDRLPNGAAVPFVYAEGSRSGATGETIFNYIVTNRVSDESFTEGFFDAKNVEPGSYALRVLAADYFGNTSHSDIAIEVIR